jgi:hypothetical protein
MKNLHRFFNRHDLPWVNLIWTKYDPNGKVPGRTMKGSFWWKNHPKITECIQRHISSKDRVRRNYSFLERYVEWQYSLDQIPSIILLMHPRKCNSFSSSEPRRYA